ncbi:probable F-box protein At1g60180 isoform X2 [Capsicum annuum]|uniref:probable F-box protein At1g60180 isoform X2 n=1 Tax=Capsicum annuum TaxID=4072 RepID=UPI0007BFBF6F|nr:probable F-box protein At1g60180 isoform X2 [Capsicum annuum]
MYSCSSLITLYLSYVVFDKGLCIAWNSLKSLTLDSTELEDDDIVRLLSSCPALETMEFSCCVGCHRLEMASSNLKTLKLHSHYHLPFVGYGTLEIFAPHLQHFDISGELQKLSCVTELIIGSWLAGTVFMMNLEGVMLPKLRCKCLTLKLFVTDYNLYGIASILQALPLLESFNIQMTAEFSDPPPPA